MRKIYSTVLEEIKKYCPNLIDELSYKEWTQEVKDRVQKWIDIVLSENDPRTVSGVPEVLASTPTTPTPVPQATSDISVNNNDFGTEDSTDDLPF